MNGTTFQKWHQQLIEITQATTYDQVGGSRITEKMVSAAVIDLLQDNRLFGEVLIRVPRVYRTDQTGVAGLGFDQDNLQLIINPIFFAKAIENRNQLAALLKHEVLHIVWQHPLRYRMVRHQKNVAMATDVAINQYLELPPKNTLTLPQLKELLPENSIPTFADSQVYLKLIETGHFAKSTQKQSQQFQLNQPIEQQKQQNTNNNPTNDMQLDVHSGWQQQESQPNITVQTAKLRHLLNEAWQQTPDKQRGLLPGDVVAELAQIDAPSSLNWRQLLKRSIGNMPLGKRDSYSRFNRRQPRRMDLPGQVTNLVVNIMVFVDNSGSMSETEISYLLNEIKNMTKVYEANIEVLTFDTKVNSEQAYELTNQSQIRYQRLGGGGTRFQSVFDYLKRVHAQNNSVLAVILSDGWGEATIDSFNFSNVLWILTTDLSEFSLKHAVGRAVSLVNDQNFQKVVNK